MFQPENASAKAFFLSPYMKQWQKPSKMVSTNSAVMVFACRTSPIQTVTSYTTNGENLAPHLSSPTLLSPRLRTEEFTSACHGDAIQLCARSLARVAGIGIFPSEMLGLALKVELFKSPEPPSWPQWPLVSRSSASDLGACIPGR